MALAVGHELTPANITKTGGNKPTSATLTTK